MALVHGCADAALECLKHLPRVNTNVLPNIEKLTQCNLRPTDETVASLSSCGKLCSLGLYCLMTISPDSVAAWKVLLPRVVDMHVH